MIATFYSYKGGVGRSMAMVNVGEILADRGYNVVLIDWDLEAPGLERYFLQTETDAVDPRIELDRLRSAPGLIDLIDDYKKRMAMPPFETDDPAFARMGKMAVRRPSSFAVPVSTHRDRPGSLRLLTAGRRDGEYERHYAGFVTSFDWEDFYGRWAGGSWVEFLRQDFVGPVRHTGSCDILLVDSRTGETEMGGICTHHLADLVVLLSAPNEANLRGIEKMARALSNDQLKVLRANRGLDVLPIRARVEQTAQVYELVEFRNDFNGEMRRFVPSPPLVQTDDLLLRLEIPYTPLYSFKERVVAREPVQRREQKLYDSYVSLTDAIVAIGAERDLLDRKSASMAEIRSVRRATSSAERPPLVLLSTPKSRVDAARRIVRNLHDAGVTVVADFATSPDDWQRHIADADRFLVFLGDLEERQQDRVRIAPLLRRQALDPARRVIALADERSQSWMGAQAIKLPSHDSDDAAFFFALADEIAASHGPRMRHFDDTSVLYPGMAAYREDEAFVFFGRDQELREIADKATTGQRWIVLGGATGIGKSSFLNAALIPAIRAGQVRAIGDGASIVTVDIRANPAEKIRKAVWHGPSVVVIDGFEELLLHDADQRVLDEVESAIEAIVDDERVWLITTMNPSLLRQFRGRDLVKARERLIFEYNLQPLSPDGLRAAIIGPVRLGGRFFERGLADRLIEQFDGWRIAPVFISETMRRLWKETPEAFLTHDGLHKLGGVAAVVAAVAEEGREALLKTGLSGDAIKAAVLTVVTAGGAARARDFHETAAVVGSPRTVFRVAEERLLRIGESVELGHPQLTTLWPALAKDVEQQKPRLEAREKVEQLLFVPRERRGGIFSGMLALMVAPSRVSRYAETAGDLLSDGIRSSLRRFRYVHVVTGVLVLLVLLTGLFVEYRVRTREKTRQEYAARIARAAREQRDPVTALLMASHATTIHDNRDTWEALLEATANARCTFVGYFAEKLMDVALDATGAPVLASREGVFVADDTGWGQKVKIPDALTVKLNADGSRAIATNGPELAVYFTPTGELLMRPRLPAPITAATFLSPDRRERARFGVAVADKRDVVTFHGSYRFEPLTQDRVGSTTDLSSGPDFTLLTVRNASGETVARLFDPDRSRRLWRLDTPQPMRVSSSAVSDSRRVVWVGEEDHLVHVWWTDTNEGRVMRGPRDVTVAAYDFTSAERLAIGTSDGTIYIRDANLHVASTSAVLRGHTRPVEHVRFDPSGQLLVSVDSRGEVRVWDLKQPDIPFTTEGLRDLAATRIPAGITANERSQRLQTALARIPKP